MTVCELEQALRQALLTYLELKLKISEDRSKFGAVENDSFRYGKQIVELRKWILELMKETHKEKEVTFTIH